MAPATTPALNADHIVTPVQNAEFDCLSDPPLETSIDVFLPVRLVEIGLLLWEEKRVDATIEMRILPSNN